MKQWEKQERDLHRQGLRRVPASGAGYRKGDARGEHFLVQCKATAKKKLIVTSADIRKATADARKEELIPVIQYEIADPAYRYALLLQPDFEAITYHAAYGIEDWEGGEHTCGPLSFAYWLVWYQKEKERKARYSLALDLVENRVYDQEERRHTGCLFAFSDGLVASLFSWAAFCELLEEAEMKL